MSNSTKRRITDDEEEEEEEDEDNRRKKPRQEEERKFRDLQNDDSEEARLIQGGADRRRLEMMSEWEYQQEMNRRHEEYLRDQQRAQLIDPEGRRGGGDRRRGRGDGSGRARRRRDDEEDEEDDEDEREEKEGRKGREGARDRALGALKDIRHRRQRRDQKGRRSPSRASSSSDSQGRRRRDDRGGRQSDGEARNSAPSAPHLFTDDRDDANTRRRISRKFERALSELSLDMLESVRLSPDRILHILEHPNANSFLKGAYVRVPMGATHVVGCIEGVEDEEYSGGKPTGAVLMCVFGIDVKPQRIRVSQISAKPFEDLELSDFRNVLRERVEKRTAEKEDSIHEIIAAKARNLRTFTFTDNDVKLILERKRQMGSLCGEVLSYRDLFQRKADLEVQAEQLKSELMEHGLENRKGISERLNEVEAEMQRVQKQLAGLRSTQDRKESLPSYDVDAGLRPTTVRDSGFMRLGGPRLGGRGTPMNKDPRMRTTGLRLPLGAAAPSPLMARLNSVATTRSSFGRGSATHTARSGDDGGVDATLRILAAAAAGVSLVGTQSGAGNVVTPMARSKQFECLKEFIDFHQGKPPVDIDVDVIPVRSAYPRLQSRTPEGLVSACGEGVNVSSLKLTPLSGYKDST